MGKLSYSGPDKNKSKMIMKLPRLQLARFVRIISGHNSLFYFRHKIDSSISPLCRFCLQENETFDHLVKECPHFYTYRCDYFTDMLITNDHKWSARDLIDFSYLPGINDALQGDTNLKWFHGEYDESGSDLDQRSGIG